MLSQGGERCGSRFLHLKYYTIFFFIQTENGRNAVRTPGSSPKPTIRRTQELTKRTNSRYYRGIDACLRVCFLKYLLNLQQLRFSSLVTVATPILIQQLAGQLHLYGISNFNLVARCASIRLKITVRQFRKKMLL